MIRPVLPAIVALLLGSPAVWAAETGSLAQYARVEVARARTSIYVGSVTMTLSTFVRHGHAYTASYTAKVFPFAFYNEGGTLSVEITDEQLARLAAGETIEFTGNALNGEGESRKVTGRASPLDASTGKLKVRVWVSPRIELIFNTTYRFPGDPSDQGVSSQPAAAAPAHFSAQ